MTQPHGGHILTFKLKKSLEISMHLGGKDINFGFGGGGKILILCKIYTPVSKRWVDVKKMGWCQKDRSVSKIHFKTQSRGG